MASCRRWVVGALLLTLGSLIPWGALPSQQVIAGSVRDSTSRLAIPGAVITALAPDGASLARTLTNERGEFRFVAAGAVATARGLRVVRLGFRPVDVELSTAADLARLGLVMTRIPYQLQEVRVAADASCPRRSDRALALGLLEQARAGLLSAVVARSDKPARMKRLSVERRFAGNSDRITSQRVTIDSVASTVTPFGAARKASEFVALGFISEASDGRTFFAPDAETLLDDEFAAGYCFHIMDRQRSRSNQVGLGFKAARRKIGRVDVDGALWIDTVARVLVDLEFRYVGLEAAAHAFDPGGRVSFREMTNGVVLIDRWALRIVGEEPDTTSAARRAAERASPMGGSGRLRVIVSEVGGELARATWADGTTWRAPLGTLRLHVTADRGGVAAGVIARLDDTDYVGMSDSTGTLEIADLAPGPYSVVTEDARLTKIDVRLATKLAFTAVRDSVTERNVVARTTEQFVAARCRELKPIDGGVRLDPASGSAWVIGRVIGIDGTPLRDVRWSITDRSGEERTKGETGTDGLFAACGGQLGDEIVIRFQRKGLGEGYIPRRLTERVTVISTQMKPERR